MESLLIFIAIVLVTVIVTNKEYRNWIKNKIIELYKKVKK